MNIDWSNAPEWAKGHGLVVNGCIIKEVWFGDQAYMILGDSRSYVYGGGTGETRHNTTRAEIKVNELRPAPWTDEGLPPAGTVCEMRLTDYVDVDWQKVEFLCAGNRKAFFRDRDGHEWSRPLSDLKFRPIRTPEQIAAEERANELNRMVATVSMLDKGWARKVCAGLYDAGYRKQVTE